MHSFDYNSATLLLFYKTRLFVDKDDYTMLTLTLKPETGSSSIMSSSASQGSMEVECLPKDQTFKAELSQTLSRATFTTTICCLVVVAVLSCCNWWVMGKKIQCIGRYELEGQLLGKGSFARVELAHHSVTGCKVSSRSLELLMIGEVGYDIYCDCLTWLI